MIFNEVFMKYQQYENLTRFKSLNLIDKSQYPALFPPHWHKQAEFLYLDASEDNDAKATLSIQQKEYQLKSGDFCIIWPGELHEIVENKGQKIVAIQFPIELLTNYQDFDRLLTLLRTKHIFSSQTYQYAIQSLLKKMVDQNALRKHFSQIEILMDFYHLFMLLDNAMDSLLEDAYPLEPEKPLSPDTYQRIIDSCSYIQEQFQEELDLEQVSSHFGFSSFYYSRCFKKVTGHSFVEYLNLQRINMVQNLLSTRQMSISEAAFNAGFNSLSTFNRVFQKYNGCSPKEYKKYDQHAQ